MSGPSRQAAERDDPACDDGVLAPGPLCEFNGWRLVQRSGGCAVLPWRAQHLDAVALTLETVPRGELLPVAAFAQAVVRVSKGRAATYADLAHAWSAVHPGGRLLVTGGNDVGITTWCRRVARESGSAVEVLASHSHARVAALTRPERCPEAWTAGAGAAPGVFHAGGLDAGTARLLAHLPAQPLPAQVLDLGCGAGHLGLAALRRWPLARVHFLDADARAVEAVSRMLDGPGGSGLRDRATVVWWDAGEPVPTVGADLALCNPPCHAGTAVDLSAARSMFAAGAHALRPGGCLLVVANRKLPYEAALHQLGTLACLEQGQGYKVLALTRPGTVRTC